MSNVKWTSKISYTNVQQLLRKWKIILLFLLHSTEYKSMYTYSAKRHLTFNINFSRSGPISQLLSPACSHRLHL